MSEKCGREEMRSAIGIEMNLLEKKLHVRILSFHLFDLFQAVTEELAKKGNTEEMSQIENTVIDLRSKVAGELTGGR